MNKKNNIYHYLLYAAAFVVFASCEDYLDVVPTEDITTIESTFEKREDAATWLQSCYSFLTIYSGQELLEPAYLGADEFVSGDFFRNNFPEYSEGLFIGDGLQESNSPFCNVWHKNRYFAALRYCNIFLDNIMKVYNMSEEEKKLWYYEVESLKAFYYFDMMRRYGPIILISKNISANASTDDMIQSRRPISEVVDTIVAICDRAIENLPYRNQSDISRLHYFSKETAATVKALTLLYAASPLFNGSSAFANFTNKDGEIMFPTYDKERWHRAAVASDEAIEIAKKGQVRLYEGSAGRPNNYLNIISDIESTWCPDNPSQSQESLLTIKGTTLSYTTLSRFIIPPYDNTMGITNCTGCLSPSMKMVEMFYTTHGVPINEDKNWVDNKYGLSKENDMTYNDIVPLNENILSLHRKREPRFYAMIAADRTYWYRIKESKMQALLLKSRQGEWAGTEWNTIDNSKPQSLSGYWIKKGVQPQKSLLAYRNTSFLVGKVVFRLPDLLLASAEAWNEYLDKPDERVYGPLDEVRKRAGILPVRQAWKSYAMNPDKVDTQAGMREIIHQEWNIEFAFESRRFWNLRRWMTAPDELNSPQYGWNITASDEAGFYNLNSATL